MRICGVVEITCVPSGAHTHSVCNAFQHWSAESCPGNLAGIATLVPAIPYAAWLLLPCPAFDKPLHADHFRPWLAAQALEASSACHTALRHARCANFPWGRLLSISNKPDRSG